MALVLEAVTLKGTDDGVTGGTYTFTSTLVNGSGNDRALVVIASGRSGAIRTVVGFDSVSPGAVFDEISVDGGNAVSTAVGYFVDADLPASSGSHNITVEWSSTFLHKTAIILEFSGADQTTPLENWGENSGTDIATSGTLAATLAGANAEFGASYLSITDNASYATPGGNTLPSGWTDQGAANEVTNLIQLATNTSVPSASEVLTWTIDPGGTSPYTSCVTGCFSVKAAAAAGASVTASVSETGDTVSAALEVPGNVTASVSETGDTVAAALSNVVQLFANVPETGDTVSAALASQQTASVTASVSETGDTVSAALTVPGNVTASVSETGDTVSAALSNVVQLFANVPETGDTVSAALGELAAASVSANVPETGDTVAAWIGLPPAGKFVRVTVGPREFRATVGKREFRV